RLALPPPDAPSFSLTTSLFAWGLSRRISATARTRSSSSARSSRPAGKGTPSSRNSFRPLLLDPSPTRRGSHPYIGIPSAVASADRLPQGDEPTLESVERRLVLHTELDRRRSRSRHAASQCKSHRATEDTGGAHGAKPPRGPSDVAPPARQVLRTLCEPSPS